MRTIKLPDAFAVYDFVRNEEFHPLLKPFRRIIHLLVRKGMAKTVLLDESAYSAMYAGERKARGEAGAETCRCFHFFAAEFDRPEDAAKYREHYTGYCEVRPLGGIIKAMVTDRVIIRPDSYTHLICRLKEVRQIGQEEYTVIGFPYIQKDDKVIMCSHAAFSTIMDYWNYREPGVTRATNIHDLNAALGISVENSAKGTGGLYEREIERLFQSQNLHPRTVYFNPSKFNQVEKTAWAVEPANEGTPDAPSQGGSPVQSPLPADTQDEYEDPIQTIYSFLEAGFPVFAVVRIMGKEKHALTIVGHTFDKNIWSAHAEPLYNPRIPSEKHLYHSNLEWIKHFIVQDDNLGPYYFAACKDIRETVSAVITGMPFPTITTRVSSAQAGAFAALSKMLEGILSQPPHDMHLNTRPWIEELIKHQRRVAPDGLVLRTILQSGEQVIRSYEGHEFAPLIRERFMQGNLQHPYWRVEISWPNLYCYHSLQVGEVIVDAAPPPGNPQIAIIRLPGVISVQWLDLRGGRTYVGLQEDKPYPNLRPAFPFHLSGVAHP